MGSLAPRNRVGVPTWKAGHLVQKLRRRHRWSIQECACRSGLTDHDIISIEDNQVATAEELIRRLRGLERAFGIDVIAAISKVDALNHSRRNAARYTRTIVLPSVRYSHNTRGLVTKVG